ncbi:uncharacterized protein VNE69_12090 [Vairimorpha necatrix]|uniref:Plasmodium RESA N-terminal domain-containing protein n=1 Tax=Vairimorpha necatrix TaxID=6039 RepID=A0AAX4JGN0_9MICR
MASLESSTEYTESSSSEKNSHEKCNKRAKYKTRKIKRKVKNLKISIKQSDKTNKNNLTYIHEPRFTYDSDDFLDSDEMPGDELLENLLRNQSLEYFLKTISKNRLCFNDLNNAIRRKLIYVVMNYNSSTSCRTCRKRYDEMGRDIGQISQLLYFYDKWGKTAIIRLIESFKTDEYGMKKIFNCIFKQWYKKYKRQITRILKQLQRKR